MEIILDPRRPGRSRLLSEWELVARPAPAESQGRREARQGRARMRRARHAVGIGVFGVLLVGALLLRNSGGFLSWVCGGSTSGRSS